MGSAAKALTFVALLALAPASAFAGQDFPQLSRVDTLPAAEVRETKDRAEEDRPPTDDAGSQQLLSTLGALGLGVLGLLWMRRRSTQL